MAEPDYLRLLGQAVDAHLEVMRWVNRYAKQPDGDSADEVRDGLTAALKKHRAIQQELNMLRRKLKN